jgi:hypothetical protein
MQRWKAKSVRATAVTQGEATISDNKRRAYPTFAGESRQGEAGSAVPQD